AWPVRTQADIRVAVYPQHRITVPLAQPGEQFAPSELTIAVNGDAHSFGQARHRLGKHCLLISQATFPAMVEGFPGQRDGGAPEANADHQQIMPIVQQYSVDEQLYLLSFQSGQRCTKERLIVIELRNSLVV